jgi:hypothetical protein
MKWSSEFNFVAYALLTIVLVGMMFGTLALFGALFLGGIQ